MRAPARSPARRLPTAALLACLVTVATATDSTCPPSTTTDAWTGDAGGSSQGVLTAGCATTFALDTAACAASGRNYITLQAWALDAADAGAAEPVLGVGATAGTPPPRAVPDHRARGGWGFDGGGVVADASSVGSGSQFVQWELGNGGGVWRATLVAVPTGDSDESDDAPDGSPPPQHPPLHYAVAWRCDGAPPCPAPRPGASPCGGRGACTPCPGGCALGACATCECAPRAGGAGVRRRRGRRRPGHAHRCARRDGGGR